MDNQNLPLELLRPIIEHLNDDLPSLLAVSLASPALRVEGQRLLFRTALSENVDVHIKFLTVIIKLPLPTWVISSKNIIKSTSLMRSINKNHCGD